MARRIATVNGVHTNGDAPPPSTLAAQIVQNQTRNTAPQKNGEARTFAELLHEILHNHAATPETDVNVNVKLVNVVAEAGLAPLATDNPFADVAGIVSQAVDSIAVIQATIRRQPEVLFTATSTDGPQLLLPLLARLVGVCGKPKCEDIPIARLLESAFRATGSSLDLWPQVETLRELVQDCVHETIALLETSTATQGCVKLPPTKSLAKLWPQSKNVVALPHGSQTHITDRCHAFMLAMELSNMKCLPKPWRQNTQLELQRLFPQVSTQLERTKQLESASQRLLILPGNLSLLIHLFGPTFKAGLGLDTQSQMAKALMNALRVDSNGMKDHVLPLLSTWASDDAFDSLHEDLRIAITTTMCRLQLLQNCPERVQALFEALRQDNVMTDSEMLASFQQLSVAPSTTCTGMRRRKKRKLSEETTSDSRGNLLLRSTRLLTGIESQDLTAIVDVAPNVYVGLDEKDACAAWQCLIDLASVDLDTTIKIVSRLIELPELHQSNRPRVLSMIATSACAERSNDSAYMDVRNSTFGQLCLRSLHSSMRELRMAAGQCLASFLRTDLAFDLQEANRKAILEYLRALSDRDIACEQETLAVAWGQIALKCLNSELNLALLRLVEYLGHTNPFICGLAFSELEKTAAAKSQSVDQLLKPFWSTIAVSVVRDLHTKPQKARQLCDLLGIEVNRFLVMTQRETIPTLVLTKKRDILQKIATARGEGTTVEDLCIQPRTNLCAILALLLAQSGPDVEDAAMACLTEVAPGFLGTDVSNLVKFDSTLVACNMLKFIGDQSDSRKSRAYQAFQLFANIAERRPGQTKAHSKSSRTINDFFDTNILGIMAYFSEVLENMTGAYQIQEKIRCVRAIAEMIKINKRQVNAALPQIRAALQSAMEQKELCEAAMIAWLNLFSVLDSEDVAHIIDQSFALILRHWSTFPTELHRTIHDKIEELVKSHNDVIRENIMTVPSFRDIPLLSKFGGEIERLRSQEPVEGHCTAFAKRLRDENSTVVKRALQELVPFLEKSQESVHDSAVSERPPAALTELLRALLDVTAKYTADDDEVAELCGKALGTIGCLDPNRIEVPRKRRRVLLLSNFDNAEEVVDWAIVLLEDVIVKAYKSVSNARAQGFLAYTIQELLRFCEFNDGTVLRPRSSQVPSVQQKWMSMPEHIRIHLTPLIKSKYSIKASVAPTAPNRSYPGFSANESHTSWLRSLVDDLMWKAKGDNAQMVFPLLARVIRGHDLAIASFMLPYGMLNVILGGTVAEVEGISAELLAVLKCQPTNAAEQDTIKLCSESVFTGLDYMSTWLQEKRKALGELRAIAFRTGHSPNDFDEAKDMAQIEIAERFLASIPAELIATRAMLCGSYARALFHWEQYIRQKRPLIPSARPPTEYSDDQVLYDRLQDIYSQIDEPDGLEGISAHLSFLSEDQQAMQHAKAGRLTAAQAWYELQLASDPGDLELEEKLLGCLRETGRYAPLIRYADSFILANSQGPDAQEIVIRLLPSVVEAHWMKGDLQGMTSRLASQTEQKSFDINIGVANILAALADGKDQAVADQIKSLRRSVTQSMTVASTSSVQASHTDLLNLHVLREVEILRDYGSSTMKDLEGTLERRLSVVGSYVSEKQYTLGVRRAVMQALPDRFNDEIPGSSWLMTAKFARQSGNTEHAYNAVLRAHDCGNKSAKVEEARLLWRDGHRRQAISALESAIASGVFESAEASVSTRPEESGRSSSSHTQNMLAAKAHLLLAKWLDTSGQNQANDMTDKYQFAAKSFQRWEKGHYYLGKHYQKLLEAELALPKNKQSSRLLSGDLTRLVVENQLRSVAFGYKYWHQTIPKILTLWLELGSQTIKLTRGEDQAMFDKRVKALHSCNRQLQKYFDRVPAFVFWSAMPQMISRITHLNPEIWKQLCNILTRIATAYPNQALWSLLAVTKSTDPVRIERGNEIINRLKDPKAKSKTEVANVDLRGMIAQGQKLTDSLLQACEAQVEQRKSSASLSKDLGFSLKLAPNPLVVPIEMTMNASLPSASNSDSIRKHKAFVQNKVTIQSFDDHVLVLSSLQRPRKITVRGSDGKQYGLLCKPKDDLRKDQRLMEFNGIINRALKRDAESSKRRLYIKTYAVTPLSEESGTIEWIEGIKPIRDILLNNYNRKGIRPNYNELRRHLDDASATPENAHLFIEKVLPGFPAVLHEWFTEVYPEPETWFTARLRYARSAAVMSVTGHVLGLGDRHGENILLEENTGGVFHVDFNCLFDKGLTFEKPELVPFRLTHNMVDAMGPYGYEGPFRKSSQLTMRLLRQYKDTLMTILETFLYDPTTDFVGKKKKTTPGVPETPQEILDGVERKLKGLLRGETVPLSVEGYVDALIREATSPWCLASMYIGWCPFL